MPHGFFENAFGDLPAEGMDFFRAYYSIFHTISAVLAKEGVAFKRHKDTLSYFNNKIM